MSFFDFLKPKTKRARIKRVDIPAAWMPPADMRRIHVHWTAGSHIASALDKEHYHFLIEGDGTVVRGALPVTANVPPLREGEYAAHTLRANSHAIGVSICAMAGAQSNPPKPGRAPLKKIQWQTMIGLVATLARHYGIPVAPDTILTHAEVQSNLGIKQRGKWDIAWLPFLDKRLSADHVGEMMRTEIDELI